MGADEERGREVGRRWGMGEKGMKGKGRGGGRSARVAAANRGLGRSRGRLGRSQDSGGLDVFFKFGAISLLFWPPSSPQQRI